MSVRAASKYLFLSQTSFRSKMAYPLDVLVRTFFFAVVLLVFTQLWTALLGGDSSVAGFGRAQLVWYLVVTEVIMLSNSRIDRRIEDDVKSGAVAYTLIRPLHFVWYQFSIYWGETMAMLVFNAVTGSLVALALVGPAPLAPAALPFLLVAVLLAFSLNFFTRMSLALLAFWVEDTSPFFWIYSKLLFTLGGMFIPLEVYPEWLRRISAALPFNYILYRPAKLLVDFRLEEVTSVLGGQIVWTTVLMGLCLLIYTRGVQKISVNGG